MLKISNVKVYGLEESIVASGYPMLSKPYTEEEFKDKVSQIKDKLFNSIQTDDLKWADNKLNTSMKLGSVPTGTGHDSYLKGIIVQYDVRYPVYWSPQFQRYSGHNHIVSSMSSMHRLTKMNLDESFNEYVLPQVKGEIEWLIELYNNCLKDKEKYKVYSWKSSYHDELCFSHFKEEILELEDCIPESIKEISPEDLYMYIISNCPQGLEKTMRVSTNYLQLKTMWHQRRNHKLKDWQVFCDEIEKLPYFKELTGCGL